MAPSAAFQNDNVGFVPIPPFFLAPRSCLYCCFLLYPQLADTLAAVPRMRPETFNRLFDDNLQDLLMVSYLSSLTRTQLAIAEKLAS